MKRLRTIALAIVAAAAAPAAIAQTQSANSDTTFASHGDPQPAQNGAATPSKKPASRHRRTSKASSSGAMSAPSTAGGNAGNMTANTH